MPALPEKGKDTPGDRGPQSASPQPRIFRVRMLYSSRLMVPSQVLTRASCDSAGDTHLVVTVLIWV